MDISIPTMLQLKLHVFIQQQGRTEGGAPGALAPGATIRGRKNADVFYFKTLLIVQATITVAIKIKKKIPFGS